MTVWERIEVLQDKGVQPIILFQNWGRNLDGASIVTAILKIRGRDVALYGHDFTVRAGSMDATNGRKLANLIYLAGNRGIPLIGMNDSAGAFVPAGVGGLDGYAEAFTALRKISGVVPSIMCMKGEAFQSRWRLPYAPGRDLARTKCGTSGTCLRNGDLPGSRKAG
jgi:acetyl-CoA carboxylase carboxyltransferase component